MLAVVEFFCGEEFFQHALPIDPSQMTRWRQRIGEDGVERLLQATLTAGKTTQTITEGSLDKIIVDTTVQPKAVEHPTDARLYRNPQNQGIPSRRISPKGLPLCPKRVRLKQGGFP